MTVIDYLTQRGFSARVAGHRLVISPASRLTDDVRKYVKAHRLELIAELAANDGQQRAWLERVAALLNTTADGLLARELIDANDMAEQYRTDPRHAAKLIASTPNWLALEQLRGQFCAQYAPARAYAREPAYCSRNSAFTRAI